MISNLKLPPFSWRRHCSPIFQNLQQLLFPKPAKWQAFHFSTFIWFWRLQGISTPSPATFNYQICPVCNFWSFTEENQLKKYLKSQAAILLLSRKSETMHFRHHFTEHFEQAWWPKKEASHLFSNLLYTDCVLLKSGPETKTRSMSI